jgi:hypothetical protein
MMNTSILHKLETEVTRLKFLYLTTLYSYNQSAEVIHKKIHSGEQDQRISIFSRQYETGSELQYNNSYIFLHKIKSQFPRYLRETIFVRLISALEVFLIDIVREVFLLRRDLFYTEQKIQFGFGEILAAESITALWSKLINSELRKLQNQGFKEIVKFYKNRLNIDLSKFSIPINLIQEYHDRRHLLVHRLGRTDEKYQHQYNSKLKNLRVEEEYLLNSLSTILEFARFINNAARILIDEGIVSAQVQLPEVEVKLVIEVISDTVEAVTDRSFHYNVGEKIDCLNNILKSYQIEELNQILFLSGNNSSVKEYVKILKKLERKNELIIHEIVFIRQPQIPPHECKLPIETIQSIAMSLPKRPWPKNIHKSIAKEFGISNTQVYAAINTILGDEKLSSIIIFKEKET